MADLCVITVLKKNGDKICDIKFLNMKTKKTKNNKNKTKKKYQNSQICKCGYNPFV